jgi:hypothetical protein
VSQQTNTKLLERAAELIDELTSHPSGLDETLIQAVGANDLNEVRRIVVLVEGELAQEHFRNWEITTW